MLFSLVLLLFFGFPPTAAGEHPISEFGKEAFRPADFPEIFAVDPVEGLASIAHLNIVASTPDSSFLEMSSLAAPPLSEGIFPCSECHKDLETNPTIRKVGAPHKKIKMKHGDPKNRWCLDCHDAKDRDFLRLSNGTLIPFEESPRLCGQCHGTIYRDWKLGIHGKRVGYWNGPKIYLLCVHCHDQHAPKFKLLKPLPPPIKPEFQQPETGAVSPAEAPAN